MDFINFENKFLTNFENKNGRKCFKLIKNNKLLVESYLGENASSEVVKAFVDKLNKIILKQKISNFRVYQKILSHKLFSNVLSEFQKSNILIEACKKRKIELMKWLFHMKVDLCVQDEYGKTALMYMAKIPILSPLIKELIRKDSSCLNIMDKKGRTPIFYASKSPEISRAMINAGIDINHKDHEGNNVICYSCKQGIFDSFLVFLCSNVDPLAKNNEGKDMAIYLAERGRSWELKQFYKTKKGIKYLEKNNQQVIKAIIEHIYQPEKKYHPNYYKPYYETINLLIKLDYDFNVSIDEYKNTPLMFFIMIKDLCTVYKMVRNCTKLDYSLENIYGDNAFSLCLKLRNKYLIDYVYKQKSLKFKYSDKLNNNLLVYYIIIDEHELLQNVLYRNISLLNQMNDKKETPLIIATKLGRQKIMRTLLRVGAEVNHQDYLGNTASYYAVDLHDKFMTAALAFYKADFNIKNKRGISTWDLIHEIQDESINDAIKHPAITLVTYFNHNDDDMKRSRLKDIRKKIKKASKSSSSASSLSSSSSRSFPKKISQSMGSLSRPFRRRSHSCDTASTCSNNVYSLDIQHVNSKKYQSNIEFKMDDHEYPYRPLPYNDVIRVIELDIYELNYKGIDHMKIVGVSYDAYYESLFFSC